MTDVTLKVNERALVRHLKLGFTSQTTVLGELMQNARRAKASVVVFGPISKVDLPDFAPVGVF